MSLAPTLYDFQIALSHVDRKVDLPLGFKVARHPSETMQRVWLRVLAYCWQWEERLQFGPGLSDPDTPDLETRDYTGRLTRWVRVGKADPLKVQRAVDQNGQAAVVVLFESPERMATFLAEARDAGAARLVKAELAAVDGPLLRALGEIDVRRNQVALTFVGDHFYLDCNGQSLDGPLTRGFLGEATPRT